MKPGMTCFLEVAAVGPRLDAQRAQALDGVAEEQELRLRGFAGGSAR